MTRQQSTVIWLGIVLIALNLIVNLAEVKSVIFGTKLATGPAQPAANVPGGNPAQPVQPTPVPNATPTANQVTAV